jgi:hypothetical protein
MADATDFIAGRLSLGNTERLSVALQERGDGPVVDLRVHSDLTVEHGIQTSTGRGVVLPAAVLPSLIRALRAIEAEVERRGLIGGAA